MTLRLVALMSFVLLLSLAAMGLLIGHYQDSVLQEVERTASQVSRAALSSLQPGAFPGADPLGGPLKVHWVGDNQWVDEPGGEGQAGSFMVMVTTGTIEDEETEPNRWKWAHSPAKHEGIDGEIRTERILTRKIRAGVVEEVTTQVDCLTDDPEIDCTPMQTRTERLIDPTDAAQRSRETVYLRTDAIHVERDPALSQLILRIPRFQTAEGAQVQDETVLAQLDEISMPIPLGEFSDLFDRLRNRSLWVFFGVFLLGTAVSAGIATRFTRPIRRLDAGIHRISAGDLDVEVDVEGKGEIARLGRAFNEMSSKLRSNRDRAREVVRQEKLSALGGLAAGVAHDVRNPLHSIGLTLQHLREACRPESPETAEEFDRSMDILRGEVSRLDQLVVNFLRFARSERQERQPVDLGDLLRETEQLIRKEAEWRGIDVVTQLNMAVPAIWADGEAIRSAVLNLVLNSFEAMPEGGTLKLNLGVEGDHVRVQIEDDGTGIEKDEQDKVFEFAYTTRETGNGLGLAMVHQTIVEEHGGRVTLESEPGVGTQVGLHLPIRPPQREEGEA